MVGEELAKHIVAALDASVAGSLFLDACAHHTAMGTDAWEDVSVDGVAMVDAVSSWLEHVFSPTGWHNSSKSTWVAREAFPCAKCCGAYRPSPGF